MAGMSASDATKYYKANILVKAEHWWLSPPNVPWLQIEAQALIVSPKLTLTASMLSCSPHKSFLDTVKATLQVWNSLISLDVGISWNTLWHLPLLTLELLSTDLYSWFNKGITLMQELYHNTRLSLSKTFSVLIASPSKIFINSFQRLNGVPRRSWQMS